jgi:hypothetical protein
MKGKWQTSKLFRSYDLLTDLECIKDYRAVHIGIRIGWDVHR